MCHLFETIRVADGKMQNIDFHLNRMNRSRFELYGYENLYVADDLGSVPEMFCKGVFRCRIDYLNKIENIIFTTYNQRKLTKLLLKEVDDIPYRYKFSDRSCLEHLKTGLSENEDILILKNGLITDTSFSNIVFNNNGTWETPRQPLLQGTMRAYLIHKKTIRPRDIFLSDLSHYQSFKLINAMLPFAESYLYKTEIIK
jgi:4-amino-4-deoxychorismate lyase